VFAGGFTLEAAEEVCRTGNDEDNDVLDNIASIEEKSLLKREESDGNPRFAMLETVREYADERLVDSGDAEEVRRKHAGYFLTLAAEAEPELVGLNRVVWLDKLEKEYGNFRSALAWSLNGGQIELGIELAGLAFQTLLRPAKRYREGRELLDKAISAGGSSSSALANVIREAGFLACDMGDETRGMQLLERSLTMYREMADSGGGVDSLWQIGAWSFWRGDSKKAATVFEECLAVSRETGNSDGIGHALSSLGMIALDRGDLENAQSLFEDALAHIEAGGNVIQASNARHHLGSVAMLQGDLARAAALFEESLETFRRIQYKLYIAIVLIDLGTVMMKQGNLTRSKALLAEAMHLHRETGVKGMDYGYSEVSHCLSLFADMASMAGQIERAVLLSGASILIRETIDLTEWGKRWREEQDDNIRSMRKQLGEQGFIAAWEKGRAMSMEAAIKYALEDEE
jgi:tetratricopeptide (TPR) repeat protein